MFPKLAAEEAPLNGDEIHDETELKARAQINAQQLLGENVYVALAERRRMSHARRLHRPAAVQQAERERDVHARAAGPAGVAALSTATTGN